MGTDAQGLLREALHRPAVIHRPGCAEGDLLDRLTRDDSFTECSCGGTSQFHEALALVSPDLRSVLVPVIHEMYVDGSLEPTAAVTTSEIVDRIIAALHSDDVSPDLTPEQRVLLVDAGDKP